MSRESLCALDSSSSFCRVRVASNLHADLYRVGQISSVDL